MPNVSYALDVDGDLPPVPLGVFPLPGYELSATMWVINADRPTVKLSRLSTHPHRCRCALRSSRGTSTLNLPKLEPHLALMGSKSVELLGRIFRSSDSI